MSLYVIYFYWCYIEAFQIVVMLYNCFLLGLPRTTAWLYQHIDSKVLIIRYINNV